MAVSIINCGTCGEPCGKAHSATFNDAAWAEGVGEEFTDKDGNWYCSPECLTLAEQAQADLEQ